MSAVLPCPFCGAEADVQNDFGRVFWIQCTELECGSTDGTEHQTPNAAIDNWNRRAAIPVQPVIPATVRGVQS